MDALGLILPKLNNRRIFRGKMPVDDEWSRSVNSDLMASLFQGVT